MYWAIKNSSFNYKYIITFNMFEEDIIHKFRLKNIDEIR